MYTLKPEWSACVYIWNFRLEVFVIGGAGAPGGGAEKKNRTRKCWDRRCLKYCLVNEPRQLKHIEFIQPDVKSIACVCIGCLIYMKVGP